MSLTNTQYDIILRDYENRQLNNRHELERKTAYVYEHIKEYRVHVSNTHLNMPTKSLV